jgi:hypothetical protein
VPAQWLCSVLFCSRLRRAHDYQLYMLGCVVNASSSFDDLGDHSLVELRKQFQETEIGRILLTVAVAVRNGIDQNPRRAPHS